MLVGSKLCCALEIYVQTLLRAPDDPWPCAGATLAMPHDQALSISSAASGPIGIASQGGVVAKGYFSRSHLMQYAPKNRVAALRPRPRTARAGADSQIANESFGLRRRRSRNESIRLGHFLCIPIAQKKQVFQAHLAVRACAAGHPRARFHDESYALILLLSTHGRDLLAQTAKTTYQGWSRERQKKLNCRGRA